MVGGIYWVTKVSFSCCRSETDVGVITPTVSSLTSQPHLHISSQSVHNHICAVSMFETLHTTTERGVSVMDVLHCTISELANSKPSMKIYWAWKSDCWTMSPEQIFQLNMSFKWINQSVSKTQVSQRKGAHADTQLLKRLWECIYCVAAAGMWYITWKCLASEYWLIASWKLILVSIFFYFLLFLDQFEILPRRNGFHYSSDKAWKSLAFYCTPLGVWHERGEWSSWMKTKFWIHFFF